VSDRVRLSIFDRSGELDAEPQLSETGSDTEVPVTIDGDSDIFTEETIGNYSISVLDEGETVASGEPREMLIGYTQSPVAKADGERIVVTTEAAGIDPDRKLEFSLFGDADAETLQTEGEYNADLDRYVFQYEHEAFEIYNQEGWGFAVDSEGSVVDNDTVFI